MSWNYRVFRHTDGTVGIKEAFYANRGDEVPNSWTDTSFVVGDDVAELRRALTQMLESLDKPIVDDAG